jgi:hypothetical protein
LVSGGRAAATLDQVCSQIGWLYPGVHPIFTESGMLAQVQVGDLRGVVGDVEVSVFVAIVSPVALT